MPVLVDKRWKICQVKMKADNKQNFICLDRIFFVFILKMFVLVFFCFIESFWHVYVLINYVDWANLLEYKEKTAQNK